MNIKYQNFRYFHSLRVRWAEVDMQKIVFNSHYLMYIDTAMSSYWREMALPYQTTLAEYSGDLYVKKSTLEYHASANMDELLSIGLKCERFGNSSILFIVGIFRSQQLLVSGEIIYVFADPKTQSSKPVPLELKKVFVDFEKGLPMVNIHVTTWDKAETVITELLDTVFVKEQGIDRSIIFDSFHRNSVQVYATNLIGYVVSTGRLLPTNNGIGKIERIAVSQVLRGSGLGKQILGTLITAAKSRGDHQVLLNAGISAVGFYKKLGFNDDGTSFTEAGFEHISMSMSI